MKKVAIFGIDNFSRKNILQVQYMNNYNYVFDIFTNDSLGDSKQNIFQPNTVYILDSVPIKRIWQVICYFYKYRNSINHVEIYPGGRFSFIYTLLSKLFNLRSILVERGDIGFLNQYGMSFRLSALISYKFSDIVWYREFYMRRRLERIGVKKMFFLNNAIQVPDQQNHSYEKPIDFLWVNRLISARKSEWFVNVLGTKIFSATNNVMLGIINCTSDKELLKNQKYVYDKMLHNLKIYGYINPIKFYLNSKFFVLPSDIVFCNNALIEAMSYGVVPLISRVEGAELIVNDGVNGFLFEHTEKGLRKAMERAAELSPEDYEEMSRNAVEKVKKDFNYDEWGRQLLVVYDDLSF